MQEQPRVHHATGDGDVQDRVRPIRYGDVFDVSGELASKTIAPQDAATMQAAENLVLGKSMKGGTAAVMQSAADINEKAGLVGHRDINALIAKDQGVTITESFVDGKRIVTESVDGQVLGRYNHPDSLPTTTPGGVLKPGATTIGEALEASARSAGDKTVDQSDAAAIQAAEVRASGTDRIKPGGVASAAQSAADLNARKMRDEDKTKLADVLSDATKKLPKDKPVTRQDAEGVIGAELRNNPKMATHPGGVAEAVATAANKNK